MASLHYGELIGESVNWTKHVLFTTFSWKKWLLLIVVMLLSNNLTTCSFNMNIPGSGTSDKEEQVISDLVEGTVKAHIAGKTKGTSLGEMDEQQPSVQSIWVKAAALVKGNAKVFWIGGAIVLVLLAIAILVFIIWVVARFEFVWYQSVVTNQFKILEPFRQSRQIGQSLFKGYLLFNAIAIGLVLIVLGAIALIVWQMGIFRTGYEWNILKILVLTAIPVLIIMAIIIGITIVATILYDFVIPIMAQKKIRFVEACKKWLEIAAPNWKAFLIYLLLRLGLFLVSIGLLLAIAILILFATLIVGGVLIGSAYIIFTKILSLSILFWIVAVVVGVPLVVCFMLLNLVASLPFSVFFRTFSALFLQKLNSGYELVLPLPEKEETKKAPLNEVTEAATKAKPKATTKAKPKATTKAKPKATTKAKPKATTKAKPKATTKAKPKATTKAKPKVIKKKK